MQNIKVGFITPNNEQILMEYFEVEDFCKKICSKDECQNEFYNFSKNYTYFNPFFDFVMIKLGYIFINPLLKDNSYLKSVGNSFYMIEYKEKSPSYQMISQKIVEFKNGGNYSTLVACSDLELHIKPADIKETYSIMLDPNGYSMTTTRDEKEGNHEITSNTILNQLLISNQFLCEDYDASKYSVIYLIIKFGFVRALSLERGGLLIGIKNFLTPAQKEYCDLCVEKGGAFHGMEIDLEKEKEDYKIRR